MKRHPRRSEEEWLNIIKECRTSGLPDKTWCLDHGIQPSKFYYHIRRLKAKACEITERDKDPHLSAQRQEVVQLSFEEPQGNCVQRNGVCPHKENRMEGVKSQTMLQKEASKLM